ncbi:MAG: hypothetical protein EZS28_029956 [Streblomastix strix]|uniref:Uncharacterized protein n=1 Tax=Streblomastix strix TaxID=222440 RepID=A0A5J4UV39_9EUKA|nr:MAG: hypothetical protein EZS28_029956 [Streblomastix strix]
MVFSEFGQTLKTKKNLMVIYDHKVKKQKKQSIIFHIQISTTHVMHKDYDTLQLLIDEDRMKLLKIKSKYYLTPLEIILLITIVDEERFPSNGALMRNLTAAQRPIADSLINLCEERKALATETIFDSFELVAGATKLAQLNRK